MSRTVLLLLSLSLVPSIASAQRRGMGGSADADFGFAKAAPTGPSISGKDFEKASPLAFLVDKKKDLKLTDAQVTALKESNDKLLAANAERFKTVDSLKKLMKPGSSAEDEARVALARDAMMSTVRDIRTSFDAAAKETVLTLEEPQRKTADELLVKQGEETQQMLRQKMGGGRGGPPGAVPGRGRGGY